MDAIFPLVLIALAVLVLVVLPQRARARQVQQFRTLQESLSVGAEVMTTSGLYGRIAALGDDTIDLEIAPGVVTQWTRQAIREVRGADEAGDTDDADTGEPSDNKE